MAHIEDTGSIVLTTDKVILLIVLLCNVTCIGTVLVLFIIVMSLLFAYFKSMLENIDMAFVTGVACCTRLHKVC